MVFIFKIKFLELIYSNKNHYKQDNGTFFKILILEPMQSTSNIQQLRLLVYKLKSEPKTRKSAQKSFLRLKRAHLESKRLPEARLCTDIFFRTQKELFGAQWAHRGSEVIIERAASEPRVVHSYNCKHVRFYKHNHLEFLTYKIS